MKKVGLTGGIATGKSYVSKVLLAAGAAIIDADDVYYELLREKSLPEALREKFGSEYFLDDGSLNRKKLGQLVFSETSAMAELNAIAHPAVRREIDRRLDEFQNSSKPPAIVFVVIPLLYEVGWEKRLEKVVVVHLSEEEQIKRLVDRSKLSEEDAIVRIRAQMPLSEKMNRASYLIDNGGSKEDTAKRVKDLLAELLGYSR